MLPFLLYVLVFLGLPLYMVLHGALTTDAGQFTWKNITDTLTQSQYLTTFKNSLILSVWTAVLSALFGVWLAAAVVAGRPDGVLRRVVSSAAAVLAYFAGVPLAFAWIATLGTLGVVTIFLKDMGFNLTQHFTLTSMAGVGICYVYFNLPLMVIFITPALEGLKPEWPEAAQNLGATRLAYLRHIAIPVLLPSVISATLILFASSFSAFATALALDGGTINIVPAKIYELLNSNVLVGQDRIGMALGVEMIVVILPVMVAYWLVQRRAGRWLQ
jgi:putative spermidine/putrescine transport system permease protein